MPYIFLMIFNYFSWRINEPTNQPNERAKRQGIGYLHAYSFEGIGYVNISLHQTDQKEAIQRLVLIKRDAYNQPWILLRFGHRGRRTNRKVKCGELQGQYSCTSCAWHLARPAGGRSPWQAVDWTTVDDGTGPLFSCKFKISKLSHRR